MSEGSDIEEIRRGRYRSEIRKLLHEIENNADEVARKVDDSFDPALEGIATLAAELRQGIDPEDVKVEEDG